MLLKTVLTHKPCLRQVTRALPNPAICKSFLDRSSGGKPSFQQLTIPAGLTRQARVRWGNHRCGTLASEVDSVFGHRTRTRHPLDRPRGSKRMQDAKSALTPGGKLARRLEC